MNFWLGLAKSDVSNLGFQIVDSAGEYATQYSFFDVMQTYSPDIIIAGAHGGPSTLTGQGLNEVLKACFNNEVLSGKVMCAISCLTGQRLGPDSRGKTAKAYIGFVNEFTWVVSPPYNPASDRAAFPSQQIVREIVRLSAQYELDQISLKEVYDGIAGEFDRQIQYYSIPPGSEDPYAMDILLSLRHDKNGVLTMGEEGRYVAPAVLLATPAIIAVGAVASMLPFLL